ncbi:MBL fold metallo-hydrolase [Tissierella sp.]|uniref:MBL fold metallo-hydrolase n=1 Tax=Tissierella sp. TaxID=41274 RepID=UPI0028674F93|nr:MBL fold metallo-hydrolase [Tissierella sp.]MDR7856579.1 MBL fold metallo-hydrolase [Tissierella sp.]
MLEKVTERIYYLMNEDKNERPALGVVKGDSCCLVFDAGNSPTHADILLKEIEKMNFPPVKYVVVSHHHWDHIFGIDRFDAIKIASNKTSELSKVYKGIKLDESSLETAKKDNIFDDIAIKLVKEEFGNQTELKDIQFDLLFSDELEINLGGVTCFLKEIVNPHREDGTILYVPEEKTVFVGDAAYGCTKNGQSYFDSQKLISMMAEIGAYEADYYLCSHESICTKEEMMWYFDQLKMGLEITKGCSTSDDAISKFKEHYNREPSNNDLFFLQTIYG